MINSMAVASPADAVDSPPQPPSHGRGWRYWQTPVLAGIGFCFLQAGLLAIRFGFDGSSTPRHQPGTWLSGMLAGLGLFFLGGLLAALVVRRLLRGTEGRWRACLIGLTAIATPIALLASLAGGLLGPPLVVLNAVVPYLVFLGIPALGRQIWLLLGSQAGS